MKKQGLRKFGNGWTSVLKKTHTLKGEVEYEKGGAGGGGDEKEKVWKSQRGCWGMLSNQKGNLTGDFNQGGEMCIETLRRRGWKQVSEKRCCSIKGRKVWGGEQEVGERKKGGVNPFWFSGREKSARVKKGDWEGIKKRRNIIKEKLRKVLGERGRGW